MSLPVFYISHGGGPCFWMDWTPPDMFENLAQSLRDIPSRVGIEPKAILVISAHWEEDEFTVQSTAKPGMIYDYYGFPEHTYKLQYPAPGSPELASRVTELLKKANIPVRTDSQRGYDHGLFVPLMMMYPEAKIPVIQLSMKKNYSPEEHYTLGKALAPLRNEGILIVGSGYSYHNLRMLHDKNNVSEPFDKWLHQILSEPYTEKRKSELMNWAAAPNARLCHPREDHLVPLFVIAGAGEGEKTKAIYHEKMQVWNFTSSSFQFGE